ncbi:hypothetical protein A2U01_0061177 [Trifolium medium]|uniref:Uncharacterized protein n=1 Tax=Trifolium medium TaxID=97028 RepID=A0A392RWG4_9FABA|nr:hypothetical protein [Trifolium medium]
MGQVYPPIMDDCQSFSLNGGISSSCSSPWVKAAPLIRDTSLMMTCPRMRSTWSTYVSILSGLGCCSFEPSSTS